MNKGHWPISWGVGEGGGGGGDYRVTFGSTTEQHWTY